jgi:hypothetical protein
VLAWKVRELSVLVWKVRKLSVQVFLALELSELKLGVAGLELYYWEQKKPDLLK